MAGLNYPATRLYIPVLLLSLLLITVMSCSRGGNPVVPGSDGSLTSSSEPNERNARTPNDIGNHFPGGFFTMIIDQETKEIEVVENREMAMHLNVRGILESDWWCPAHNCIKIQFLEMDEINYIYKIKGTLINPSYFNGFDVRVIIFYDEDKEHDLLNADDYTRLYEDGDFINPFRSYAKTVMNRQFNTYASFSEIFDIYVPPAPKKWLINFAIDASWPENCEEPYDLEEFGYDGYIYPDDPDLDGIDQGVGTIFTECYDWQGNILEVSVDTTPVTGGITYLEYNTDNSRWEAVITNCMDAEPGEYECLIAAYSEDDPSLGLYNYLTVTVDETPPPAVQTIAGKITDSFWLTDLDGSVVSVVNQDPLGFIPEPVSVVNGEYLVNVTTGTYNVSVVPPEGDLVHHSTVCWDVVVSEEEDISLDLGLFDPTATDPYGYGDIVNWYEVTGFAGKVVNTMGMPVSSAYVEITTPDSWGDVGQDFVQGEVTDENGYFSIINCMKQEGEYDLNPINSYDLHVRAPGYIEAIVNGLPGDPDMVQYQIITLLPGPSDEPVWEESFEDDTGWAFLGYWHRQQYYPGIFNQSYDPANNFVVMPADEEYGGEVIPPVDGEYYMWYGVEPDGNFIGEWDTFNEPYGGGDSMYSHEGWATSPDIDLSAYTQARLEFWLSTDIETNIPSGYDMTRFYVHSGLSDYLMDFYNPFCDPGPVCYTYTQRGYNRTMMWCFYSYDITPYVGDMIQLRFHFMTNDGLYNGNRGTFIDDIKIYAE